MEYRRFERTLVVRLDPKEEILLSLIELCRKENIKLASVTGLGAVDEVYLGVFDTEEKKYYSKEFKGLYEIASLMGSISEKDGDPYLHLHMVIGNPISGECHSGHLSRGVVSATAEIIITEIDGAVGRIENEEIGLNLFKFN
jgi:hypothetical protein